MKLNIQLFAYTKKEWKDLPSKDTPILAADLNNIENGVVTKQDSLVSGTNIKTINGNSILGSGNLDILNMVYPVGSIYMSVNSTSPATLFGGTWEQIKDRFLLGAGDSYTAGSTGGEAMHTLTIGEMPPHSHEGKTYSGNNWDKKQWTFKSIYNSAEGSIGSTNTGGGQPHNNMPPYLVVYVWKRTA